MLVIVVPVVDRIVVIVTELLTTIVAPFFVSVLNIIVSDVVLIIVPGIVSVDGSVLICGTIVMKWSIVVPVVVLVLEAVWIIVLCTTFRSRVETILVVLGIVAEIGGSVRVCVVVGFEGRGVCLCFVL